MPVSLPACVRSPAFLLALWAGLLGSGIASAASAQPAPPDTVTITDLKTRKLFVQGMTQAYLDDFDEAVALFEDALDRAPNEPALLSALADAEAGRSNLTSAIYYAEEARAETPDHPHYPLQLARLLTEANRLDEAARAYRSLLDRTPGHRTARRALARLQQRREQPRAALRHYEALAADSAAASEEVYVELLSLYDQTGNPDGVERTLKVLIERRRDAPELRRRLGRLYLRQGRHEDAIPLFESLRDEFPGDLRVLSRLKMLYLETNQPRKADTIVPASSKEAASPDQLVAQARSLHERSPNTDSARARAETVLRRALDQAPAHVGALDLLGTLHVEAGRPAEAAAAFERALDANPRSPTRWERAARAFLAADSLDRAVALADEGALLFPGRAALPRIEAQAHLRRGNAQAARDHFRTAIAHTDSTTVAPDAHAALYTGLGRALARLGDPEAATAAHSRAVTIAPDAPSALQHCARHLAAQDAQLDRALRLARRAVDRAPGSAAALGTLGWVLAQRDADTPATAAFERALATGAAPAWVYERFGDLQQSLGNEMLARRYWRKALESAPERDALKRKLQSLPEG
jgi:tetratricopeptide (TPR) repeat protein